MANNPRPTGQVVAARRAGVVGEVPQASEVDRRRARPTWRRVSNAATARIRYPEKSVSSVVTRIPKWLSSACDERYQATPAIWCPTPSRAGSIPTLGPMKLTNS